MLRSRYIKVLGAGNKLLQRQVMHQGLRYPLEVKAGVKDQGMGMM